MGNSKLNSTELSKNACQTRGNLKTLALCSVVNGKHFENESLRYGDVTTFDFPGRVFLKKFQSDRTGDCFVKPF